MCADQQGYFNFCFFNSFLKTIFLLLFSIYLYWNCGRWQVLFMEKLGVVPSNVHTLCLISCNSQEWQLWNQLLTILKSFNLVPGTLEPHHPHCKSDQLVIQAPRSLLNFSHIWVKQNWHKLVAATAYKSTPKELNVVIIISKVFLPSKVFGGLVWGW